MVKPAPSRTGLDDRYPWTALPSATIAFNAAHDVVPLFLAELETMAPRYRQIASDLHVDVLATTLPAVPVQTSG